MTEITEALAQRVLEVVDAGLASGLGKPIPGQMCVEAAICYAFGEPHGDEPSCVAPSLRAFKIGLNDASTWTSNKARAQGMRRLALAQLGSKGILDEVDFVKQVTMLTVNKILPRMLRRLPDFDLAIITACEEAMALASAEAAAEAAARGAARAAALATGGAARAAARGAARAAAEAARAARTAGAAGAAGATWGAARAAKAVAAEAAAEEELILIAEEVVQILVKMDAPGCQWLFLTEKIPD